MSNFHLTPKQIKKLLSDVHEGELGLPAFQRSFRWEREMVRQLLISILNDFPAGSLLFYCPGASLEMGTRPLEKAPPLQQKSPELTLILDGQQRLTSLYQSLKPGSDIRYYLDVERCQGADDPEEFITYAIPKYQKIKGEYRIVYYLLLERDGKYRPFRPEAGEKEKRMLPLPVLCDDGGKWLLWLQAIYGANGASEVTTKVEKIRSRLLEYEFPVVVLTSRVSLDRICFIFEKVNSTGLQLTLFELLTAKLYRPQTEDSSEFNLAKQWEESKKLHPKLIEHSVNDLVFLQTLALLKTRDMADQAPSCRRAEIFRLTNSEVKELWPRAINAIERALEFLQDRAGIRGSTWNPFPTMLPAVAAIIDLFDDKLHGRPEYASYASKLLQWYWCSVFSNRYSSAVETKNADDMRDVIAWIRDGRRVPEVVKTFSFNASVLQRTTTRSSAVYQGVFCLLLSGGLLDFSIYEKLTQEKIVAGKVQDHHIFPRAYLANVKRISERTEVNTVLNRTLINEKTNAYIKAKAPSDYLAELREAEPDKTKFHQMLESHLVPTEPDSPMDDNDYAKFLAYREKKIASLIESKTGGKVFGFSDASEEETEERETKEGTLAPADLDELIAEDPYGLIEI